MDNLEPLVTEDELAESYRNGAIGIGFGKRSHGIHHSHEVSTMACRTPHEVYCYYIIRYAGGWINDGRFNDRRSAFEAGVERARQELAKLDAKLKKILER